MGILNSALCVCGAGLAVYAIYYYRSDCSGSVSPSMGADMSFNGLWVPGVLLLSLGILPAVGVSRWWSVLAVVAGFALSFPVRRIIEGRVCVPYKPEPSGFQEFVRTIEKADDSSED
ncbi:MAG: hypothetical protein GY854_08600 [Deltaproteobacteria bacterium]|nr:hypothetical protein [Deltaproteobacteria bacterium]